jgi:hypothetical protein
LVREALADGEWHDGPALLREIMRKIPPGEASRHALAIRKRSGAKPRSQPSMQELIESGRRARVRLAVSNAVKRGTLETDVELGRPHLAGELPWRLRDPMAGYLTAGQVADALGFKESTIRTWVDAGYVPHSRHPAHGWLRFSPEQFAVCQRVREVWPGPGSKRWPIDPRSLWNDEAAPTQVCPHCNQPIQVTLTKAH